MRRVLWLWLALGGLLAYGLAQAAAEAWICDDAFISLRYARHLVAGEGLVFNIGERVEGYTNFLWTLLLALVLRLGGDPVRFAIVFGIASYLLTTATLIWASRRAGALALGSRLPLAGCGLWVHHDAQIWASSGLETSTFAWLITLALVFLLPDDLSIRGALGAGTALLLATLTRPDGLLFFVVGLGFLVALARPRLHCLVAYAGPMVVVYLPYWIWRFVYYGYPYPNTYYAKSAHLPYYSQGWEYLWLFLRSYYVLLIVPLLVAVALPGCLRQFRTAARVTAADRPWVLAALFVVPYAIYVVRVGGDFMFARFLMPVVPAAYFLIESLLSRWLRRRSAFNAAAGVVLIATLLRWDPFSEPRQARHGIVDESSFYTAATLERAQRDGRRLRPYVEDPEMVAGFAGGFAMLMYYAEIPVAIEVLTGLTDEHIAHQPLVERGRPGHEKPASPQYLVERGASILFTASPPRRPVQRIVIGGVEATLFFYRRDYLEALRARGGVEFPDFPAFLDRYFERMWELPDAQVREDGAFFYAFYFAHNRDDEREARLQARLAPSGAAPATPAGP